MSCDTSSPRLSTVKQTYGRINKTKKGSDVANPAPPKKSNVIAAAAASKVIKEEPVEAPQTYSNHSLTTSSIPDTHSHRSVGSTTPTSSRNQAISPASSLSATLLNSLPPSRQSSLLQFASPRTQPPKSLTLTPPKSVPNILRRTPVKQGGGAGRKQTTPKSKSVNLSPILYSPKIKKKNPFFNEDSGTNSISDKAHIITSYVKVTPQNKKTAASPRKKSMGSQCNINVPRMMPVQGTTPKLSNNSPKKHNTNSYPSGEKVLCNVELQSEDLMIVSHTVNGRVFSGILVADSHRSKASSSLNCGYVSEQLPSQYRKKLKARLGLSFESGCESENSDSESTKSKLQKLKYSDFKSMKDSIAVTSSDPIALAESTFSSCSDTPPAITPKSRQNVPYQSTSNHNKKSINGLTDFLREAASTSNQGEKTSVLATKNKESTCKSKDASIKAKETIAKNKNQPKTKDQAKMVKPSQPRSNPNSPKKQKVDKAKIITENVVDKPKPNTKLKFGEKFVRKISPTKDATCCDKSFREDPATIQKKLLEVSRHFRMRYHSLDDQRALCSVLADNSAKLNYVDLEWPVWCPRKLKLEITPTKRGKPARFKLEKNGSKRRRTESNESELMDKLEEMYTENNNPFGIGDVVIAKYTPGPGRPYWPGKVISVTGLTVCVLFYNTSDVMQIAKCNVEWFYDGCKEHKITLDPENSSEEWKEALEEAENDVKSCIGKESIVWGLYEDEWWPARVLDIEDKTYTVEWLDDNSLELLPLSSLTPFLLSYNVKYSEHCAEDYDNYQGVVDEAHSLALAILLDTQTALHDSTAQSSNL